MTVLLWVLLADLIGLAIPRIATSDHAHRAAHRAASWVRLTAAVIRMEVSQ